MLKWETDPVTTIDSVLFNGRDNSVEVRIYHLGPEGETNELKTFASLPEAVSAVEGLDEMITAFWEIF